MRGLHRSTAGLLLGHLFLAAAAWDRPSRVEIFTDAAHPVTTESLTERAIPFAYYDLDAAKDLQVALSANLPGDPKAAEALVRARLAENTATALIERATKAWQGAVLARTYGIDRIPAIVFEGRAIVYGATNAGEALERYHAWKESP